MGEISLWRESFPSGVKEGAFASRTEGIYGGVRRFGEVVQCVGGWAGSPIFQGGARDWIASVDIWKHTVYWRVSLLAWCYN